MKQTVKSSEADVVKKVGEQINEFFSRPVPFPLELGGTRLDLQITHGSEEDYGEFRKVMETGEEAGRIDNFTKIAILRTLRDPDGNPIWSTADELGKIPFFLWNKLKATMLRVHFGIDIIKPEEK